MAIEYLEIRDGETREIIGICDAAQSVIWHNVYYGTGDFEIYIAATERNIALLQVGNFVTRPFNGTGIPFQEFAVIERVEYTNTVTDGKMVIASGRIGKSILDRRHIYQLSGHTLTPTILQGIVETAARSLVYANAIDCDFDADRNIDGMQLGRFKNYPELIVDDHGDPTQKQVSFQNLLEYVTSLLEEYGMSCQILIYPEDLKMWFEVYKGIDRSMDNTDGNEPVIFSIEYDNLTSSDYTFDLTGWKNAALIGGEGEGVERFYSLIPGTETGLERRETFFDDSSISKSADDETTYTDAEYDAMLISDGLQKLVELEPVEDFNGTLNIHGGVWRLGRDYDIGDIVTVQDNALGFYVNVRITEITETQDENGYNVEVTYAKERTN